jgi:Tfp pilus assembly pilus retraction ATPase PilT
LNLPPVIVGLVQEEERGIIFVTGAIGSGKSTMLVTMLDLVNCIVPKHIVTIEDLV